MSELLSSFCREHDLEGILQDHYNEYQTCVDYGSKNEDDIRTYGELSKACRYGNHIRQNGERLKITICCRYLTNECTITLDTSQNYNNQRCYKIASINCEEIFDSDDDDYSLIKALKFIKDVIMEQNNVSCVYGTLKYSYKDFIDDFLEAGFDIDYSEDRFEYRVK